MGVFRQFPYSNFHEMNMDEIIKIVKNMLEEWAQYYNTWDDWKTQVTNEWSEMQDFINNYFDNLDVQTEINNKITAMVNSGEFSQIVDPYVPPAVASWLADHITQPVGVVIDTSLSVAGACADAKATGDAIALAETDISLVDKAVKLANNSRASIRELSPLVNAAMWDGEVQSYGVYRATTQDKITFTDATNIYIATGFWIQIAFFVSGVYSNTTAWAANFYTIPAGSEVRISIRLADEDTTVTANLYEFSNAVTYVSNIGKKVADLENLCTAIPYTVQTKGGINASNYSTLGFDSVTDLPPNTIWGLGSDLTNAMITDLPSYGSYGQIRKTAGLLPNNIYIVYEYTNSAREHFIAWQSNSGSSLSAWTRISTGDNAGLSPVTARTLINSSSKVIFIGDSIVAGVGGTGFQQDSGRYLTTYNEVPLYANDTGVCWANMMVSYLETNYGCTAYNNGLSGFNSVNIVEKIEDLIPNDATHVIGCWGINDRAYNYNTVSAYQSVNDYCSAIGAKFIPVTICPCIQPNNLYPHTQYEIVTKIKTACNNNNLEVCDLFSAINYYFYTKGITLDINYLPDNLHPNDAMYTIIYNVMRNLLTV